jgi:hypothetical protein
MKTRQIALITLVTIVTVAAIIHPSTGQVNGKQASQNTEVKQAAKVQATLLSTVQVIIKQDDEPGGPVFIGTFKAVGDRSKFFAPIAQAEVRKVRPHSNSNLITFEDGSWALDADGQYPYDTTGCTPGAACDTDDGSIIFEDGSWIMPDGTTGCLPWGTCNE